MLRRRGLDPVWKDHDLALTGPISIESSATITATSVEEGPSQATPLQFGKPTKKDF
jgi:hypothetical protein